MSAPLALIAVASLATVLAAVAYVRVVTMRRMQRGVVTVRRDRRQAPGRR